MTTDRYRFVSSTVLARREGERPALRCTCCGTRYRRGSFTCCAPPLNMASRAWLELSCPMPPKGCGKCARHCTCPSKTERIGRGPLADLGRTVLSDLRAAAARPNVLAFRR